MARLGRPAPARPRNRLLAALPPETLARLWPRLEPVEFATRHTLHAPGEPITAAHFPERGWASMVAQLGDGDAAEVGLVGTEGVVGLPLLFGVDRAPVEVLWQAGGAALRLGAGAFREAVERDAALRGLLLRYAMAFHVQISQTAACNGRHVIERRLARWMLMAHDRAEGDAFPMTHELLSMMLGVRRPGVTIAAGMLQKAGLIRYGQGRMAVADRRGLEAVACECYAAVRREFERLLGPQAAGPAAEPRADPGRGSPVVRKRTDGTARGRP